MVASLGVISALRFAHFTHTNPPIIRANILGNFLKIRMATYSVIGWGALALNVRDPSGEKISWLYYK